MLTVPQPRKLLALCLALLLGTALLAAAGTAEAGKPSKVDSYKDAKGKLKIKERGGKYRTERVASNLEVKLTRKGQSSPASINELVPGAKIVKLKERAGKVRKVTLAETPSGSSDCSFDMTEEDEPLEESFDCDRSYEGEDEDCSFDQSGDASPGDSSKDTSWDCSFSDDRLEWDCSYDSSQSASVESDGGDSDADLSFDCSWESEEALDEPLWDCALASAELSFVCRSGSLGQEFGAGLDTTGTGLSLDSFVDFSDDYKTESSGESSSCVDAAGSASCSFDGDGEVGDCDFDFSFDRSHEADFRSGDVSGDISMSCDYDIEDEEEEDDSEESDDA